MVIPSVVKGWKKLICSDIAASPENQLGPTFPSVTVGQMFQFPHLEYRDWTG